MGSGNLAVYGLSFGMHIASRFNAQIILNGIEMDFTMLMNEIQNWNTIDPINKWHPHVYLIAYGRSHSGPNCQYIGVFTSSVMGQGMYSWALGGMLWARQKPWFLLLLSDDCQKRSAVNSKVNINFIQKKAMHQAC
jgi:hypothetical protein